jgi:acyl carrier protein
MSHAEDASEIPEKLIYVFRDLFKDYDGPITRATTSLEVPGWDSLSHAELIMLVEDHFNVVLETENAFSYQNLGELIDDLQAIEPEHGN